MRVGKTDALALSVGLAFIGLVVWRFMKTNTRGWRNNNPGNIRKNDAFVWNGETGKDERGFVMFDDPMDGVRAMGKIIDSYQNRGVLTVQQIISTYAPKSENATEAYIDFVVKESGLLRTQRPLRSRGDYVPLIRAMILFENARVNLLTDEEIAEALARP